MATQAGGGAPAGTTTKPQPDPISAGPLEHGAVLCLDQPDWIQQTLRVSGPSRDVAALREAALGAGRIPWQLDLRRLEEDWTTRLMAMDATQRELSAREVRLLTRELRETVEARIWRKAGREEERSCPFDLHVLVPIPNDLLARGPGDPAVLQWLWENWGTTWGLRGVEDITALLRSRGLTGRDVAAYRFWSADWTPWRAIETLRVRWPTLSLTVSLHLETT